MRVWMLLCVGIVTVFEKLQVTKGMILLFRIDVSK